MTSYALTTFVLLVSACIHALADANNVTREIYCEHDVARVRDLIELPLESSRYIKMLHPIIAAKENASSNLSNAVATLYEGEDLKVERFDVEATGGVFRLWASLRVLFRDSGVANLYLVPTYAGAPPVPPHKPDYSEAEAMIQLISDGGTKLVLFPEWKLSEDDPAGIKTVGGLINLEFMGDKLLPGKSDLRIRCLLRPELADEPETLLDYKPDSEVSKGPDVDFMARLHSLHPMSGNDVRRLFTKVKLAKPGYYPLGAANFTNKPPIVISGKPWIEVKPLFPREVSDESQPKTAIQIDGNGSDWSSLRTRTLNIQGAATGTDLRTFTISSISYMHDTNYLYLFFKFKPSVEERFKALFSADSAGSIGNIALVSCDIDADVTSGFKGGDPQRIGTDVEINITAGNEFTMVGPKMSSAPMVSYGIGVWETGQKRFVPRKTYTSVVSSSPLIAHGTDGVELALRLSDLGVVYGAKLRLVIQYGVLQANVASLTIDLK